MSGIYLAIRQCLFCLKNNSLVTVRRASSKCQNSAIVNALFSKKLIARISTLQYPLCTKAMDLNVEQLINDPRRHFDYKTLLDKKEDGYLMIIDVRQPEELAATGTIPESVNIPLAELDKALSVMTQEEFHFKYRVNKPSKKALLIFSCQSGRRSLRALSLALHQGYLNSANYRGGWVDWESHTARPTQQ